MSDTSCLLDILKDMLHERLGIEKTKVSLDTSLADLGIDSLMQIELMFDFEDKYKVKIPDITDRPSTIGELLAVIEPYIQKP
ncbi:hypothetical protein PHIN8_08350 [Polynucleobacter sp. HIN8]|uniref:acyl carrier protein n=1 Tax=Polynucleobacter sp. HIN8 TaxID=3047867 RepID=UPI0025732241|nr:phosphopantetheine-binding protein [Polynucleobacter sp. HIN8]BEI38891.1 hypothetical protein PHIN8_08350 [Polynucleobacter sp. HIN8]